MMGWWSAAILGGDTPLDYLGVLATECGAEFDVDSGHETLRGYNFCRHNVERYLDDMVAAADSAGSSKNVALQVLGVIVLHTGATIPDELRGRIIDAANNDEWMREEGTRSERGRNIFEFIASMEAHTPGSTASVHDESLFEKMSKVFGNC